MKKILSVLFATVLLLSGCSNDELISQAFGIYTTNIENYNKQEGLGLSLFGTITSDYDDTKSTTSLSGYFLRQGNQSDSTLSFSYLTGEYYDYIMASDGEYYVLQTEYGTYEDSDESESTTDEVTASEYASLTAFQYFGSITDKSYIKKAAVKDVDSSGENAKKQYIMTLDAESASELAEYLMEAFGYIDTDSVPVNFDVKELICTMTVDNETGEISLLKYSLDAAMEAEGEVMNCVFNITYYITGTGDDISVSVGDLSDYVSSDTTEE